MFFFGLSYQITKEHDTIRSVLWEYTEISLDSWNVLGNPVSKSTNKETLICLVAKKKSIIDKKIILSEEIMPEYMKTYWKSTPAWWYLNYASSYRAIKLSAYIYTPLFLWRKAKMFTVKN